MQKLQRFVGKPWILLIALVIVTLFISFYLSNYPPPPMTLKANQYGNSMALPQGAHVSNLTATGSWLSFPGVKSSTVFLVGGQIMGIQNTTEETIGGEPYVQTIFAFSVNFSLIGNIPKGKVIAVSQPGGIARTGANNFVNLTFDDWPLLSVGSSYVLALGQPNNKGVSNILGPDATFPLIQNNLIQLPPTLQLTHQSSGPDVSVTQFMQIWNSAS